MRPNIGKPPAPEALKSLLQKSKPVSKKPTRLWLELLRDNCKIRCALIDPIWQEADELISIFITMSKNTKTNRPKK